MVTQRLQLLVIAGRLLVGLGRRGSGIVGQLELVNQLLILPGLPLRGFGVPARNVDGVLEGAHARCFLCKGILSRSQLRSLVREPPPALQQLGRELRDLVGVGRQDLVNTVLLRRGLLLRRGQRLLQALDRGGDRDGDVMSLVLAAFLLRDLDGGTPARLLDQLQAELLEVLHLLLRLDQLDGHVGALDAQLLAVGEGLLEADRVDGRALLKLLGALLELRVLRVRGSQRGVALLQRLREPSRGGSRRRRERRALEQRGRGAARIGGGRGQ